MVGTMMTQQQKSASLGAALTVLIVDDSRLTLLMESMVLKQMGYRVVSAETGKEALKILSRQHIDFVLTDIHMPEMRGDELASQIRLKFPGLPVFAITTACIEKLKMIEKGNFETILKKPLTANAVKQSMRSCLQSVYA